MRRIITVGALLFFIPMVALANGWTNRAYVEEQFAIQNSQLPVTEGPTRWDSILLVDSVIVYHFTFLDELADQEKNYFLSEYAKEVGDMSCALGPELFEAGLTVRVLLVTKTNEVLSDMAVTKFTCTE